jgi:hypothetical protein
MKLIFAVLFMSSCTFEKPDKANSTEEMKHRKVNQVIHDFKDYSDSVMHVRRVEDSLSLVFKDCF